MPTISIITVTLNNLQGLQTTHASIQSQTQQPFEWIVVDGASNDGTVEWLNQNAPNATSESDHGLYDAMNKGLSRATGDYVIFMNAGDRFAGTNVLEIIHEITSMAKTKPGFLYGDALEPGANGAVYYKQARPFTAAANGLFTHHQSMVYARDVIGDLRYDTTYEIAADYKFTLQNISRTKAIYYIPAPLCIFEPGGISQRRTKQGRKEQYAIRRELNTVASWKNKLIYARQSMAMSLRLLSPRLYWALKSRRDSSAIR